MVREIILAASACLAVATPCSASQWYRLANVEGAKPNRVIHAVNLENTPDKPGVYTISYVDLFETSQKDDAARVSTQAILNCKAKTLKPDIVQRIAASTLVINVSFPKGAHAIKAGTTEDKFRAAVCDGSKVGLVEFDDYDPTLGSSSRYFIFMQ